MESSDPEAPLRVRALASYERGDPDLLDRLDEALAQFPGDGGLLIAQARARAAAGDPRGLERLGEVVRIAPDWIDGQAALAQLRWEAGERETFLEEYESALRRMPGNGRLWTSYINAVAGTGASADAARLVRRLRAMSGDSPELRLIEAHHAGMAGDLEGAESLLASVPDYFPDKALEAGRHRLRRGDPASAAHILEQLRGRDGMDNGGWALLELAWRGSIDPRHAWLVDPEHHFGVIDLAIGARDLDSLAAVLRGLHHGGGRPLGQSVRQGTQTRGNLWRRREAEIAALREILRAAVAGFVQRLPRVDEGHPLAPCFGAQLELATGWSIRLRGGGHHVNHIHAHGILSSACYIALPAGLEGTEGWLELGRPPADIALDLPPLATIEPRPGRLVLFPSYVYHGTRPFLAGERLTVAFDAAPVTAQS